MTIILGLISLIGVFWVLTLFDRQDLAEVALTAFMVITLWAI